ncbi:MAG: single-stranded DNA-binding protein [Clostridia bacterium]|nr:single-stranded DNA-binding protein [Clostridia bacterium]
MANFNLNKVILGGRLTTEPELKSTTSGVSVITFTVAVNRRFGNKDGENQADFIRVTAWRQTAEFVSKFFHKGSSICVVGSIQTRSWTDNNGQKRYETEVVADEAYFVDSKSDSSAQAQKSSGYVPESYGNIGGSTEGNFQNEAAEKLEQQYEDDELPF